MVSLNNYHMFTYVGMDVKNVLENIKNQLKNG